jgi:hypothetical protein
MYKDKKLSANLPYKVEFLIPADGKDVKLIAHLVSVPLCCLVMKRGQVAKPLEGEGVANGVAHKIHESTCPVLVGGA